MPPSHLPQPLSPSSQGEPSPSRQSGTPSHSRSASLARGSGELDAPFVEGSARVQRLPSNTLGPGPPGQTMPDGAVYDRIRAALGEQMPKLPGPLLSAVTICLMEARPRGYAPLGLHADVPNIPQGLADGSSQLAQDDRYTDRKWCAVLADDLKNKEQARSNGRQYALDLLAAMKQAYMAGASLPAFAENGAGYERAKTGRGQEQGGNAAHKEEVPAHLESALLQLIQDPSLADPPLPNSQLPPSMQGPPFGTPCDLPEEAAEWLGSRAFERFQAAALKDMKNLLLDKGGLTLSEDIDFGSHQMTTPASLFGHYPSHLEPLASLVARMQPSHTGEASGRALYFRTMSAFNRGSHQALLADVRIVPARPHTFALLDDAGITKNAGVLSRGRGTAVKLPDGRRYLATLIMDASAGPHREEESGVLHALVLFTFLVPWKEGSEPGWALHGFAASRGHSCGCCALLPGGGHAITVIGRRVSVSLARRSDQIASLLRVDARPFVIAALKTLFEQPPTAFHAASLDLSELFGKDGRKGGPPLAARAQRGQALAQRNAAALDAASKGSQQAARYSQRLHRMLRLEESAMESDICRYDMFNVRLSYATVFPTRRYTLQSAWRSPSVSVGRYLGPSLDYILPATSKDEPPVLAVVEVPGLPEGRPALLLADTVYLRAAEEESIEYAAAVVAVESTLAFLALPQQFWDSKPLKGASTSSPSNPLFHVRFTFDRTPLRRMHAAVDQASNPHFQELPAPKDVLPDDLYASEPEQETVAGPSLEEVDACAEGICEEGMRVLNFEQRLAVASVLCGAGGGTPFALFGPPGTGKTVTLVECALQVLKREPAAKLLLCAPQNYSADLLASALSAKVPTSDMLRLNDPRRPPNQVKADVLPYCKLSEPVGAFMLPSSERVAAVRVIVATCGAAGILREGAYPGCSFTHVMIDEAGQALLPEALVPLTLLRQEPGCRALLCGDPRQLGPVVRSVAAATGGGLGDGLTISLLERFIDAHREDVPRLLASNRAPATGMLVRNYRSHSSLLQIPNRLFYGDSLLAAADQRALLPPRWDSLAATAADREDLAALPEGQPTEAAAGQPNGVAHASGEGLEDGGVAVKEERQSEDGAERGEEHAHGSDGADAEEDALDEEHLPSTLFFGVRGQQMREGEAPSYFNAEEAAALVGLVEGLLAQTSANGKIGVQPNDLGVIATYRKQVQKIRLLLRERGLGAVRVGTVDDYQGQEERIIFISTVLTKRESLPPVHADGEEADVHVGFWRNPKRFNVAITRARALLVVVGHPVVLMEDPSWRELLRFCALRGAYRGAGSELMAAMLRADGADGGDLFGFANALTEQPPGKPSLPAWSTFA
ncbi:P-loop containing nucleoside triphosphate hydrolase protein [Coccomyxa subellipsoidea C-169]|uniref:P-loop containing nucleoside triphosphate hydrolase protein n=1 Tax=Coccomyxa subellipsoidea (strain C-169) TaxID=574566 RepID=I0Z675_COCSC|nr:P-loop containing nucleoside triphosphate hydrolase protein [Coccomyxa subellipsoidea C-169]EIE26144.1 P-loop containing nucleoside triphosphate hydrolase protein [Coccomyxa subellipsoidea C-169]|eukprot:XP_005650688.1 P-loop containing nucleoside triphosphate hydrolase protein [Coccomyxa subellipsoidea C-169]